MSSTAYWNQMYANACDAALPSAKYRPRLFIDGNQWCALFGDNTQDGVAGFGESPGMAYFDFDRAWCESLKTHNVELTGAAAGLSPQRPATEGSEVERRVGGAVPPAPTFGEKT